MRSIFPCCYVFEEILIILVHRSMSSTCSLLSSLGCFTINRDNDGNIPPNFGAFSPGAEIQFNRYAQNDNTGVITTPLCQTEGRRGCDGLAFVMRHPDNDVETFENNITLIILPEGGGRQVANLPNVALNCNPSVPAVGQDLEAFGWGSTAFPTQVNPNEIQTATIKALTNADCKNDRDITDDILCAKQAGISMAGGDSGTCDSSA
jgi:hypothetical protein